MAKKDQIKHKRYIIKKYIMATSAHDALKRERRYRPDDVWVDDDWKKENPNQLQSAIGFNVDTPEYFN